MKRLTFDSGFARLLGWVRAIAWLILLATLTLMLWTLPSVEAGAFFPFIPFYEDQFVWILLVGTLARPPINFALCLPFVVLRSLISGFIEPDETTPETERRMYEWFKLLFGLIHYVLRLLTWGLIVGALVLFDVERNIEYAIRSAGLAEHTSVLRYGSYILLVAAYGFLRVFLGVFVGGYLMMKLEALFAARLGEEGQKRVLAYNDKLIERRHSSAIARLIFGSSTTRRIL